MVPLTDETDRCQPYRSDLSLDIFTTGKQCTEYGNLLMKLTLDVRPQFDNPQTAKLLTRPSQMRQNYISLPIHLHGNHGFRSSGPNPEVRYFWHGVALCWLWLNNAGSTLLH